MKKLAFSFVMILAVLFFVQVEASAEASKRKRPPKPEKIEEAIPERPSPYHVWDEGRWKWNKKQQEYVWKEGEWAFDHNFARRSPYGLYNPYFGFNNFYSLRALRFARIYGLHYCY